MEYRTAISCLKKIGLIEIAANKQGMIITLVGPEMLDVYVDEGITDRTEQPTASQRPAKAQPTRIQG